MPPAATPDATTQSRLEALARDGFVILEDVLDPRELSAVRETLAPYLALGLRGRNDFEGTKTQRVYSLVGRGRIFEHTAEHPDVLTLVDRLLVPNYLLTASQAICIAPGETPQPVHSDDAFVSMPRPRDPVSISTIWAVDDFTADNGGTEVIPGSHRWSDDEIEGAYLTEREPPDGATFLDRLVPVEMRAGSCVVFSGTLLHRGGANRSPAPRRAFSHQYCQPWARPQENFVLSVPRDRAARMSPRLQGLLGYSIHPPFVGQVAARHPLKVLAPDYENSLEADDREIARHHRRAPLD